ncbi:hypothetical protein ACCS66_03920 [Rhizobium ruizarguesonis]
MPKTQTTSSPAQYLDGWSVTIPADKVKFFDKDGNETTLAEAFKNHFGGKEASVPNVTIDTNGPVNIEVLRRKIAIYDELTAEGAFYELNPAQWGYAIEKRGWLWDTLEEFAKADGVPFDADYRKIFFSKVAEW